jgi:hypothetical protein
VASEVVSCLGIGSWELGAGSWECKNGGDRRPRFWRDAAVTASCRPSSSRPWHSSSPLRFIPPFVWDSIAKSILRIAAPLPPGTLAPRPYAARSLRLPRPCLPRRPWQKNWGCKVSLWHPPDRSAAVSASFRPFSCRPLHSSSPLVPPWNVAAQLVPVTRDYNRWAERSTLIQDVVYG